MRNWGSLFHVKLPNFSPKLHASPGQVFVRAVLSARLSEYENVREEERTVSVSRSRVPVPNARLKRRRKAEELAPSMAQTARTETARGPWDARSNFDSGTSCKFMPYGQLFAPQIGPSGGAEFAKQHSSAMRCVPRTDAVVLAFGGDSGAHWAQDAHG